MPTLKSQRKILAIMVCTDFQGLLSSHQNSTCATLFVLQDFQISCPPLLPLWWLSIGIVAEQLRPPVLESSFHHIQNNLHLYLTLGPRKIRNWGVHVPLRRKIVTWKTELGEAGSIIAKVITFTTEGLMNKQQTLWTDGAHTTRHKTGVEKLPNSVFCSHQSRVNFSKKLTPVYC